jgi:hypothetical protein
MTKKLLEAARLGNLSEVNQRLNSRYFSLDICSVALREAAIAGHLAMVERLLQLPVLLENAHLEDNAVLQWAAWKGHLAMVKQLLQLPRVLENAHASNNAVLQGMARHGYLEPGVAHLVKHFGTSQSTKMYSEARRLY